MVAVGECGLDYDRCELRGCARSRARARENSSLHARADDHCARRPPRSHPARRTPCAPQWTRAVVHSFDGSAVELGRFLALDGMYVGINGCSLKTEDNLEVAASVPLDRLLIETDAPWCEIRASSAAAAHVRTRPKALDRKKWTEGVPVKGRNEPAHLVQVAEALAGARGDVSAAQLAEATTRNAYELFLPDQPR